jgi:hypothetical protein
MPLGAPGANAQVLSGQAVTSTGATTHQDQKRMLGQSTREPRATPLVPVNKLLRIRSAAYLNVGLIRGADPRAARSGGRRPRRRVGWRISASS